MIKAQDHSFGFIFLHKQNFNLRASELQGVVLEVDIPTEENALMVRSAEGLNQGCERLIRWASGGGVYVINQEWVPLVLRSSDALTNPNKLTISSGRSDFYSEIENPLGIIRELFEEITIFLNGSVLIPDVDLTSLGLASNLDIAETINSAIAFRGKRDSCSIHKADLVEEIYLDKVSIKSKVNVIFEKKVCLHVSNDLSEVNFMHAVALNNINLEEVQFIDTEKSQDASGKMINLNRRIYLLNLKDNNIYKTNNGCITRDVVSQLPNLTAHAELLIARLRGVFTNGL